jgi:hypothetical protein
MLAAIPSSTPQAPIVPSRDGLIRVVSNAEMVRREAAQQAQATQNQPVIIGLAGYIRSCFDSAKRERLNSVEKRMLSNLRARRGEYDPDKLSEIRKIGGSEVYMMLTSVKCRAASSWLKDVFLGTGSDKPWEIDPTPVPDLPPQTLEQIGMQVAGEVRAAMATSQQLVGETQILQRMEELRDMAERQLMDVARKTTERMERRLEDEQIEGGFIQAFSQFLDDLTVYPSAFLKGPVVRKKTKLAWVQGPQGWVADLQPQLVKEWERVDPYNIYPAPHATGVNDGFLIEKHTLTRKDLNELVGVPGYNEAAIREVLDEHGKGGLKEWLTNESTVAALQEKTTWNDSPDATIDALQFWGSVQGKHLIEWGMDASKVADPMAEYDVEAWLVGRWVIKATLNELPCGIKPYFKTSFEELPGCFWGNGVADLITDVQSVCNATARSLVNNMGISSGPQVWINVQRMPPGENLTNIFPWKIWQGLHDPLGSTAPPIEFFQPNSHADELMRVFEFFSRLADDYSGIPRYITGGEAPGGAGRTASGLSMLQNNAGKGIKQVALNIDVFVLDPLLKLHHYYVMKWDEDESIKGDVQIHSRGARGIIAKEATQLRRNEFLAATSNPIDLQLLGPEARMALLREAAKTLDMNIDKVVPDEYTMRARMAQAAVAQAQAQPQQPQKGNGERLQDGTPTTDHFSPTRMN